MAIKPEENGRLERTVKMDYSETYRENDKLDLDLDQHLVEIVRSQQRFLSEKDEELEVAKAEAERSLKLKEAAERSRQENGDGLGFLSGHRRSSLAFAKILSEKTGEDGVDASAVLKLEASKPTLTERRIAMERDLYSAKRMFNVVRKHNMSNCIDFGGPNKSESPSDSIRKTMAAMTLSKQQLANGRPHTQPSRSQRSRGYLRPTTSTASRLSRVTSAGSTQSDVDGYGRAPRRARSRLELEKLCRLNIDPFEDLAQRPEDWPQHGDPKDDMLKSLRIHSGQIQARVAAFLKDMEDFNKRNQKSRLDHILGTAR